MSHIIPFEKINQFLPVDKLSLNASIPENETYPVDHYKVEDLEATARDIVFGNLAETYDVTDWSNGPTSMPSIVRNILGMLVAGWVYDRQFAEEGLQGTSYGQRRIREAYGIMNSLMDGTITINEDLLVLPHKEPSTLETDPIFTVGFQF
jgi:hypothetical protein